MRIQIDHLKFGQVWYSDGHCIIIHNFLQNHFNIGEDLSSSDGEESVTISIDSDAQQPQEPEVQKPAEPQPATTPPPARKSNRAKIPRKMFTL